MIYDKKNILQTWEFAWLFHVLLSWNPFLSDVVKSGNSHHSPDIIGKPSTTFMYERYNELNGQEYTHVKKTGVIICMYSHMCVLLYLYMQICMYILLSERERECVLKHLGCIYNNVYERHEKMYTVSIDIWLLLAEDKVDLQDIDMNDFPPSFKQQTDFLLTSKERLQLKKCLKEYSSNQWVTLHLCSSLHMTSFIRDKWGYNVMVSKQIW